MMQTEIKCVICGARCIPVADYDPPVCIACDVQFEAIDLYAALTERLIELRLVPVVIVSPAAPDNVRPINARAGLWTQIRAEASDWQVTA